MANNKKKSSKSKQTKPVVPAESTLGLQQAPTLPALFDTACRIIGEQTVISRHQAEMQAVAQYAQEVPPVPESEPTNDDEQPHLEAVADEG